MTERLFITLRELEVGQYFMFYADDLENRGPCKLLHKGVGSAEIEYAPRQIVKTIKGRDHKGQIVERTFKQTVSGWSLCALGAQVVPIQPPEGGNDGTVPATEG